MNHGRSSAVAELVCEAARRGDVGRMHAIVQGNGPIGATPQGEDPIVLQAIEARWRAGANADVIVPILASGVNLEETGHRGDPVLHATLWLAQEELEIGAQEARVIDMLIEAGARADTFGKGRTSTLYAGAFTGWPARTLKGLGEAGAETFRVTDGGGLAAHVAAAFCEDPDALDATLGHNRAELEAVDLLYGHQPLQRAIDNRNPAMAIRALELGAPTSMMLRGGIFTLDIALNTDQPELFEPLIRHGADPDQKSPGERQEGNTPRERARGDGAREELRGGGRRPSPGGRPATDRSRKGRGHRHRTGTLARERVRPQAPGAHTGNGAGKGDRVDADTPRGEVPRGRDRQGQRRGCSGAVRLAGPGGRARGLRLGHRGDRRGPGRGKGTWPKDRGPGNDVADTGFAACTWSHGTSSPARPGSPASRAQSCATAR